MNRQTLSFHFSAHPEMTPVDAVKLCYQSAFGCGHLIADEAAAAERIAEEIRQTPEDASAVPFVSVGSGQARMNLACPEIRAIPAFRLARMMRLSAEGTAPSPAAFEESLLLLRAMAAEGAAPFSAEELDAYLADYPREGYPPVSHSARYRELYRPAYRVVLSDFTALPPLIAEAERRLATGTPALFAADGPCASGKTTLMDLLARLYGTEAIHLDDFFLPPEMRTPDRLSRPGGNVHYERFLAEVLQPLRRGGDFTYRAWDCFTGEYAEKRHAASSVTVIEGSYSHHPAFREICAEMNACLVYVDADPALRLERLRRRNPERMKVFLEKWIPLEKKYFEAYDIARGANVRVSAPPREAL